MAKLFGVESHTITHLCGKYTLPMNCKNGQLLEKFEQFNRRGKRQAAGLERAQQHTAERKK